MINSIHLKFFRQHKDLFLTFTGGMSTIRGPNEGGKSTILEAIGYALYGSKALRNPLADVVTWEHKETELSVDLVATFGSHTYRFLRSSAGAEIWRDDEATPFVTGQNDCTEFAADLVGAPLKTAERLMFAKQSKLTGALEEGPTAVAAQIETLCDFDVFDTIIERMQRKLLLGVPTVLESNVKSAEEKLAAVPAPVRPDTKALQNDLKRVDLEIATANEKLPALKESAKLTYAAYQNAENGARMHQTIQTNLTKHERDLALHEEQAKVLTVKIAQRPSADELAAAKVALTAAKDNASRRAAHQEMTRLMAAYPELFWEGSAEELDAETTTTRQQVDVCKGYINAMTTTRQVAEAKIVTSSICPTCGQDVSTSTKVQANNAEQRAIVAEADAALVTLKAQLAEQQETLTTLENLRQSAAAYVKAARLPGIVADFQFVPPKLAWSGPIPTDEENQEQQQNRLSALEERDDAARRAEGQAEIVRSQISDDRTAIGNARDQLAQYPAVEDTDALRSAANNASGQVSICEAAISQLRQQADELTRQIAQADSEYQAALAAREGLVKDVIKAKADLETLHYNNALLKKIRAIRPLVADQLWNQVLAAVSAMFSRMRGENSLVSKSKDGFRVNGKAMTSYSGSALDLLGLSIRVALMKTFLPHCPFLILDEPMAACSDERSALLLGFVASAGFDQIILVTHEENSEAVSDQLIELAA